MSMPPMPAMNIGMNPAMNPAVVDAQGMVIVDNPCRKCSYNLRGLSVGGRCPECGTPVGVSVMGDLLRFSNPQWLRKLQSGVKLILWSIVVAILGTLGVSILSIANPALRELTPVVSIIAGIMGLIGAWWLTEPDPSGVGEDKYGTSRRIIRVTLIVGVCNTVLTLIQQASALPPTARITLGVITLIAGLVGVVGQFAQLNYLSKLALRIPDFALSDRARFLMWAIGISYGVVIVFGAIAYMAISTGKGPTGPNSAGVMTGGCIAGLAGLALLVFWLMYLRLLHNLGKAFGAQAVAADATWANAATASA